MISNGIKAVQKFEEFVENSIEEDCYYECPKVGFQNIKLNQSYPHSGLFNKEK